MIHTCVYHEWYKFKTCNIKTCKYYSKVTNTNCMAIDREQPTGNKIISDAELHYYKFGDQKLSTRIVSLKRKKAIDRVKCVFILYKFIEYIRESYKEIDVVIPDKLKEKIESKYPFTIKKLGYRTWMLPYLFDEDVFERFLKNRKGECNAYSLNTVLNLTSTKFKKIVIQLKGSSI